MKPVFFHLARFFLAPILDKFFIEKIEGLENIPKENNFIVAVNHESNLDHFLIAFCLKDRLRKIHFIGKMEGLFQTILFWGFYFLTETISLDRRKKEKRGVLEKALVYLKKGAIIIIYPEGTRNKESSLKKGKTGAAELAIKSGLPILPMGLKKGEKKYFIKIGKPLFFEKNKEEDYLYFREMTDKIMKEIASLCGKRYLYFSPSTKPDFIVRKK